MEQEVLNEVETETTTTPEVENNSDKVVRKFTQEEVNEIVKERLAKAQKGQLSKEELTKYNEWKESQKTQQDKYDDLIKQTSEKDTTISNLKKENLVLKAGITDVDKIEFVCYKVGKMEGDFEENLIKYLADNPSFVKKTETQKATGTQNNNASSPKESGVTSILRTKHPELFD